MEHHIGWCSFPKFPQLVAETGGKMKHRITATIDGVTRWRDHLRFEREVFNASLAGVDHSFSDRYEVPTDT